MSTFSAEPATTRKHPNAEVTGSPDLSASPCGLTGYATEDDK